MSVTSSEVLGVQAFSYVLPYLLPTESSVKPTIKEMVGILTIYRGATIYHDFELKSDLVAMVSVENDNYIVTDHSVEEYGIGESLDLAKEDLLSSLVDYYKSLVRREARLSNEERKKLSTLRDKLQQRQ